ncbi:MAG: SprT-like domain-containing protein [Chitinophagaceae bacterium]
MSKTEHPMQALAAYLPEGSFEDAVNYINHYKVHLTVTRKRQSVLGDYRHAAIGQNHRISINGNLNKYEFLITLLHEIAHLLTFEQFSNRVDAHGKEWKQNYSKLLVAFLQKNIFPADISAALYKTVNNPAATANGETELLKVLRNYNTSKKEGFAIIEQLPIGSLFETEKGRVFKKGLKRRKRYECLEISTGKLYSFSAIAEVKLINQSSTI